MCVSIDRGKSQCPAILHDEISVKEARAQLLHAPSAPLNSKSK